MAKEILIADSDKADQKEFQKFLKPPIITLSFQKAERMPFFGQSFLNRI